MRRSGFVVIFVLFASLACFGEDAQVDAERSVKIAEIRARFDAAMDACSMDMVREADPGERADVALAIGAIFELGLMSDPDPVKAASFFSIASELDSAEADCALGNLYSIGVESKSGRIGRDMPMAVEYWGRAAVDGSIKAMLELGKLYTDGSPEVPRDTKKALNHFMNAASRGNKEALDRLEPIMEQAREWERQRPGRKANFPTSREALVKADLERADRIRSNKLDKIASHVYVELNRRVAEATGFGKK